MTKEDKEKLVEYAALISEAIQEKLDENETDFQSVDWTLFIHALANLVPGSMYNSLTGDNKNTLEFNHLANKLCFQYMDREDG